MTTVARLRPTVDMDELLRRHDPVSLEELVDQAGMMTRIDRKYVLPVAALDEVLLRTDGARALTIDGRRSFGYRSDYLDTLELSSYHAAGRRRRRRWKVRGRVYLDTGTSWLEVKTRGPRGTTVKHRVHHGPVLAGLDPDGQAFVAGTLADSGIEVDPADLLPVITTRYRRSTLQLPDTGHGTSRATLDVDLRWTSPGGHEELVGDGLAIVETKGGRSPSDLDRALWRLGHRPARISKFGTGLAALHEDLPDLTWHRTLQRHLLPAA